MRNVMMFFVLIFILSINAFCAKPFQGKVTLTLKGNEENGTIILYAQGQKVKMEPHLQQLEQKLWLVLDNTTRQMTLVFEDQAMYMTMALEMMKTMGQRALPGLGGKEGKRFDKKPTATGKIKTILGHECHQYIIHDDNTTTEMWVAHDLGTFPQMLGLPIPQYIGNEDFAFFPLEVTVKGDDNDTMTITATEVSTVKQDDSQFVPPASYKKVDLFGGGH